MIDRKGNVIKPGDELKSPSGFECVFLKMQSSTVGLFEHMPNNHRTRELGQFIHTAESLKLSRWEKI